jgi:hypothetical protein
VDRPDRCRGRIVVAAECGPDEVVLT